MPIMGPLAAGLGFSPEVMVMIFSSAIGVVNLFTPTSGALKFAMPLIVILTLASMVITTVACMVI